MSEDLFTAGSSDMEFLSRLVEDAEWILIKKLSNNDRDWARFSGKHQNGVYIPREQRDGGFFDPLTAKERGDTDKDEIREVFFKTIWPQLDGEVKDTRLVHYTSKGQETHMTGLPKKAFQYLSPASFLVMSKFRDNMVSSYHCLTIDSSSEEALFLRDFFNLGADTLIEEFHLADRNAKERDEILNFVDQVLFAWNKGVISSFAIENAFMPESSSLAAMALTKYLEAHCLESLDPFSLLAPGDALREISRDIEWSLFREYQKRERCVQLIRSVIGDIPRPLDSAEIIRLFVNKYEDIDAIMLSASQQRKSRAGLSYENHIETLLKHGHIPFEKQVIIESKKRPDFILPSLSFIQQTQGQSETGFILSAKTTLKERWKQVEREKKNYRLFLTTVDENIAANVIEDMASFGVYLVIPESLMHSKQTEYAGHQNVISFKTLCEAEIKPNMRKWRV